MAFLCRGVVDVDRVFPVNLREDGVVMIERGRWSFPAYLQAVQPLRQEIQLRRAL